MRWVVRLAFALVALVILGAGLVFLIPAEKIAGLAVGKFKDMTGRELVIAGSIRPTVWPVLGVKTGAVQMANAEWSDEGPMFQAEALEIAVDMAALLGGEVKVTAVEAVGLRLVLERAKDGRENWVFGGGGAAGNVTANSPGVGAPFTLGRAVVSDGVATFIDHKAGTRQELTGISLTTAIPDFDGPVDLSLSASCNGQAFEAQAKIGAFRDFLDGKVVPLGLTLTAGKADIGFNGRAGWNPLAAEGDVVADLATLAEVAALAGAAAPALPQDLGAGGVSVKGALTLTDAGSAHLRGGTVTLDDTVLATDADWTMGEARPKLSAKVLAGALNLRGLTGSAGQGGGNGGGAATPGWPKDRIDVSGLGALDASIALTAESVDLGLMKLGETRLAVTIDRARAVFDIRRIAAYDGTLSGQFVVNGRKGLSVGGDLGFADMALQPLLMDFAGYDRLLGKGDLRLKFLGIGNSLDEIMQGLEGSGSFALGKGELRGLDVAGMLRTLDTGYVGEGQKTIFDSVGGSFTVNQGVLENAFATLKGAGKVGLGARNLNYRLKATAMLDDQGGGITAPLLIKGPWADPQFSLDLEALANEQLAEEKAALEAAAKAKAAELEAEAKAKLEEELGVVVQDGESLEDALQRRGEEVITDEAAKALEKLLGGGN